MVDEEARAIIESMIAMIGNCNITTGYCCCGSPMEAHTMYDGHSPVDQGEYAARQLYERAMKFLGL